MTIDKKRHCAHFTVDRHSFTIFLHHLKTDVNIHLIQSISLFLSLGMSVQRQAVSRVRDPQHDGAGAPGPLVYAQARILP